MVKHRCEILLIACALAGCNSVSVAAFAAWDLPEVPESQAVQYEYRVSRDEELRLIPDLVIGTEENGAPVFRTNAIVAIDGHIFVKDIPSRTILEFDAVGLLVRRLSRAGQGPGELASPGELLAVEQDLVVPDIGRGLFLRLRAGSVVAESPLAPPLALGYYGLGASGYDYASLSSGAAGTYRVELWHFDSPEPQLLVSLDREVASVEINGRQRRLAVPGGDSLLVTSGGNPPRIFIAHPGEAQIAAFTAKGTLAWAAHLNIPRRPLEREAIDRAMESLERLAEATGAPVPAHRSVSWPPNQRAISRIQVDGEGRLYVVANVPPDERGRLPVDVFDGQGQRVFAGMAPDQPWSAASEDYVFSWRPSEQEHEQTVVRYRIQAPFLNQ